jgi:hypothetical protein
VSLSTGNPDANAAPVAAFMRQTCLDAGGDSDAVADAVQGSGWGFERIPAADPSIAISLWRLDQGELVHALVEIGPGARVVDCQLELDAAVAPSIERMRDALRPVIRQPSMRALDREPPAVGWQWSQAGNQEWRLTIGPASGPSAAGPSGRRGIAIHVAITERPPAPALPAQADTNLGAGNEGR